MMKVVGIIPARYASTRYPGKPLKHIRGLPMIVHVMKRAMLCERLDAVYVATDSEQIARTVTDYGGRPIMTGDRHQTGTDRIAEAAANVECDIVVNIQGDEPLVRPDHIARAIEPLIQDRDLMIATLMCETTQFNCQDECKIVVNLNGDIMYMSRSDIPSPARVQHGKLYKLYSIVPFRRDFLFTFSQWEQTPLEEIEYIEYLRALEHGVRMRGVLVDGESQSVDTEEDRQLAERLMATDPVWPLYGPLLVNR